MDQKMNGLSRDLIIHPGETLSEILDDRGMTQKELAARTGVTEKHVSTIINGVKPISTAYAKKLEYALGIDASFWINLQANYDQEIIEFEEVNNISKEEISIIKILKNVIEYLEKINLFNSKQSEALQVIDLRKILCISNLTLIPNVTYNAAYRAHSATADVYVLFAWQKICEILTSNIEISESLDVEKLKQELPKIKALMYEHPNTVQERLTSIFAKCGIAFRIVKHFHGAPVQGFIKKTDAGRVLLCMTIRGGFADIFWFTLFHEIAHIINGDVKERFVDFESVKSDIEDKANKFARDYLINKTDYAHFVKYGDFSLPAINMFADKQHVKSFIVIGRLQKEELLPYTSFSSERIRYKWADD